MSVELADVGEKKADHLVCPQSNVCCCLLDPGTLDGVNGDCHAEVEDPDECEKEAGGLGAADTEDWWEEVAGAA